jgi:hypothetical protein
MFIITTLKIIVYIFYVPSLLIQKRDFLYVCSAFSFTLCKKNRQPQITIPLAHDIVHKLKSLKTLSWGVMGKRSQFGILVANIDSKKKYF